MTRTATSRAPDLSLCQSEPIHIPGALQPFGTLLVLDPDTLAPIQVGANCGEILDRGPEEILGTPLDDVLGRAAAGRLRPGLESPALGRDATRIGTLEIDGRVVDAVAHRHDGLIYLELEGWHQTDPVSFHGLYPLIRAFPTTLERASSVEELCQLAAEEARRIVGFDRVLVYRFDPDESGTVVAEDRNGRLPSYLGLRFPASDIPRQARALYRLNRLRLIADVDYAPVPLVPVLNPGTGRPLDLSHAALRSVSPVHLEYMRNMGTGSSMSVSILRDGSLWGLVSCHNAEPRYVPFELRSACDVLAQILSLQLDAQERRAVYEHKIRLKSIESRLLAHMAEREYYLDGLVEHPGDLLDFAEAGGAAIVDGDHCTLLGDAPAEAEVRALVAWLAGAGHREVYATDALADEFPPAAAYKDRASGLLALGLSRLHTSYLLWFRPEIVRTVTWGGDPGMPAEPAVEGGRIHPRRSFELWKETVRLKSAPWRPSELEAAHDFRHSLVGIVLRKAEELAEMSAELSRSNRELEAFSYSVSHDLRAPFRHIVGYAELLLDSEPKLVDPARRYARTIIESAQYAGLLVDNLLSFAHVGRATLQPIRLDMNALANEVRADVMEEAGSRAVRWEIGDLPEAQGDPILIRLALRNLLSNALKYTRPRAEAVVALTGESKDGHALYCVRDNGIGFDMKYIGKLFGVFQRLHRMEDFEGTGIGLANVKRIIDRHGGEVWAEGAVDHGATFWFTLPTTPRSEGDPHVEADPARRRQPERPGADAGRAGEDEPGQRGDHSPGRGRGT